jgi:crotonobetainyl-CoA:carnitine CoA-transferase CaiB-like acyl-CoA transferase
MTRIESGPLDWLKVIEVSTSIPAAACAQQFARWGAQVQTIGRVNSQPYDDQDSLLAESLDSNKTLIEGPLDQAMIDGADVLIIDKPIDTLPITFSNDSQLILLDISTFGRRGEYAHYAGNVFIAEAMSGFMSVQGEQDRAPLTMPANIMAKACGVSAFNASLAAIHHYQKTGTAQAIEFSCMQLLCTIVPTLRTQVDKPEARDGGPGIKPLGVRLYQFGEGYLSFNFAMKPALSALLDIIGLDDSHIPDALASTGDRQDYAVLKEFVEGLPSPFDAAVLFEIISAPPHSSAVGKVLQPAETIQDPQLDALKFWQTQQHPKLGTLLRTGPPARLSLTPAVTKKPLETLLPPFPAMKIEKKSAGHKFDADGKKSQPLSGIKIIDLTQAWIGPFASQTLSDLGAEVIKVESLTKPDVWRKLPPKKPPFMKNPDAKLVNSSCNFNSVNRDKKSLVLDLSQEQGKSLFLELVAKADIVMENYRPNVMPKLGLDYEALRKVNPEVIVTSFSAYGEQGPYSGYRGNGTTIEAISGWDSMFGYADGPPLVMGFYQADAITGLQMAATTLVALMHRDQSGKGQHVQGSMFETAVDYIEEYILLQQLSGDVPRDANRSKDNAPQGVYPSAGEDNWMAISIESDEQWASLCKVMRVKKELEPNWNLSERIARHDDIDRIICAWTRERTAWDGTRVLQSKHIAAAPVQTTDKLLDDEHLQSIDWWHQLDHPDLGEHLYAGFPYQFSISKLESKMPSARLGQHSKALLKSELALSDKDIQKLFDSGVSGEDW